MKPASFERIIRLQFDTLAKRVVDTTVKDYNRALRYLAKHEKPFSELPEIVVDSFAVMDEYEIEKIVFVAHGIEVPVQIGELSEALKKLSDKKRNVVLLFYFTGLSDIEIGEMLDMNPSTSYRNRMSSLEEMKQILEMWRNEDGKDC